MLLSNFLRIGFSGMFEGSAQALLPGQWDSYYQFEKYIYPDGASEVLQTVANPPGHYLQNSYQPPILASEMSMRTDGIGSIAGSLIATYPMSIDLTGASDFDATAALVVSMLCALGGSGALTATIQGRLNASVDFTGAGDLEASLSGLGNMVVNLLGAGDLDATIAAFGDMAIDIVVTGTGLSTANVGQSVWSAVASANNAAGSMGEKLNDLGAGANPWDALIESGMTASEVLRVILAGIAGNCEVVDNGNGTYAITFKSVDGSTDRIAGTATLLGERSGTVLDGS